MHENSNVLFLLSVSGCWLIHNHCCRPGVMDAHCKNIGVTYFGHLSCIPVVCMTYYELKGFFQHENLLRILHICHWRSSVVAWSCNTRNVAKQIFCIKILIRKLLNGLSTRTEFRLSVTLMQLREPKIVVEVTQVFLQCMHLAYYCSEENRLWTVRM